MGRAVVRLPPGLMGCRGAVLDTMVWIYLFEDHPRFGSLCEGLLKRAAAGDFAGIVTPVTLAEIIVKPLRAGRMDLADTYRAVLRNCPNVTICGLSGETGAMAGALRAKYGLPLPDMLQCACAMEQGGMLITNDTALRKVRDIRVILMDEIR